MKRVRWFVFAALCFATASVPLVLAPAASAQTSPSAVHEIEIVVQGGYQPARIVVTEGERVRLRFVRLEYSGCTHEVVFPSLGIRRELPPNQPVVVDLPAITAGEIAFHCGMHMIHGIIVVQPRA